MTQTEEGGRVALFVIVVTWAPVGLRIKIPMPMPRYGIAQTAWQELFFL